MNYTEQQVINLLEKALSIDDIAKKLSISPGYIKTIQRSNKLGITVQEYGDRNKRQLAIKIYSKMKPAEKCEEKIKMVKTISLPRDKAVNEVILRIPVASYSEFMTFIDLEFHMRASEVIFIDNCKDLMWFYKSKRRKHFVERIE